jgi:hypothetical protein
MEYWSVGVKGKRILRALVAKKLFRAHYSITPSLQYSN